jgi:uncharacterized membrane protein SirB2
VLEVLPQLVDALLTCAGISQEILQEAMNSLNDDKCTDAIVALLPKLQQILKDLVTGDMADFELDVLEVLPQLVDALLTCAGISQEIL